MQHTKHTHRIQLWMNCIEPVVYHEKTILFHPEVRHILYIFEVKTKQKKNISIVCIHQQCILSVVTPIR